MFRLRALRPSWSAIHPALGCGWPRANASCIALSLYLLAGVDAVRLWAVRGMAWGLIGLPEWDSFSGALAFGGGVRSHRGSANSGSMSSVMYHVPLWGGLRAIDRSDIHPPMTPPDWTAIKHVYTRLATVPRGVACAETCGVGL